jgi:hypothetical protein
MRHLRKPANLSHLVALTVSLQLPSIEAVPQVHRHRESIEASGIVSEGGNSRDSRSIHGWSKHKPSYNSPSLEPNSWLLMHQSWRPRQLDQGAAALAQRRKSRGRSPAHPQASRRSVSAFTPLTRKSRTHHTANPPFHLWFACPRTYC